MKKKGVVKKEIQSKKEVGESLGISGLTLGVVGLAVSISVGLVGIIISIVGIIFSAIQQKKNKTKMGLAGLWVNSISLVINLITLIFIWYVYTHGAFA